MRKQQAQLLEKARAIDSWHGFNEALYSYLSREDLTIRELEAVFDYFVMFLDTVEPDQLIAKADSYLKILKKNKKRIANCDDYNLLLCVFFDCYYGSARTDKVKMRIFKMYLFLLRCAKKNGRQNIDQVLLQNYIQMLDYDLPLLCRTSLLRPMLQDDKYRFNLLVAVDMRYATEGQTCCFIDEYKHNCKKSFFYHIAFNLGIIKRFSPSPGVLEDLYDRENHRFIFDHNTEFSYYFIYKSGSFIENAHHIALRLTDRYPVISLIRKFCEEYKLSADGWTEEYEEVRKWSTRQLADPGLLQRYSDCCDLLGQGFSTNSKAFHLTVYISDKYFTNISYTRYQSVHCYQNDGKIAWVPDRNHNSFNYEIVVTPDGKLLTSTKSRNLIPLSMKVFMSLYNDNTLISELLRRILSYYQQQNRFYNDVVYDFLETPCLMPLSFNEVMDYHNRAELIRKKYKAAEGLHINWNKQNLVLSYLIVKSYPLVEYGVSREILIQQKDLKLLESVEASPKESKKDSFKIFYDFLQAIILKSVVKTVPVLTEDKKARLFERCRREVAEQEYCDIDEVDEYFYDEIKDLYDEYLYEYYNVNLWLRDYCNMCRQSHIKVRLDIHSFNQLRNLHDEIANDPEQYRKKTGKVKVPPRSKFLPLRKILPAEFEWIKTRKRLIQETVDQHHCVWSYAHFITNDECAIYSFLDSRADHSRNGLPQRYTIEFRQDRYGKYYVAQVQGKYNKVNANGMREYIQTYLEPKN